MGLPVKLSETLVAAARSEAKATNRSITAQVEHWARLGCAVEATLSHGDMLALKLSGGDIAGAFDAAKKEEILELLREVASSTDRSAVKELIGAGEQAVYTTDPDHPGMLVRVEPDGTRVVGKLEGRNFVPENATE
jgi:hypothetical protein